MKKKATKKSTPTASRKKTVKDLEVKPAKSSTVRGGKVSDKSTNKPFHDEY